MTHNEIAQTRAIVCDRFRKVLSAGSYLLFGFAGSESLDTYYVLKLPALFAVLSADWNSN